MSVEIRQQIATGIDRPIADADQATTSQQPTGNSVTTANPSQQQASTSSPTAGGRDETRPLGFKELEQLTEERLAADPEYVALKAKLDSCAGLEELFHLIDKTVGFQNDDTITMDDILALVNDTNQPNKAAREAAKWLNDHRAVLSALKKGDNLIGVHDVKAFIAEMKAQLKEMKNTARADIQAEHGVKTAAQGNAAGAAAPGTGTPAQTAAATAAQNIMEEAGKALPKPPPSQFSGMEGAAENMNNMIGWAEAETDRLTMLMGKTDDPAVLKQLETKINQMSRRMQQMTALMNQLMTAMQNISKMYSEIAMNSVRNMR